MTIILYQLFKSDKQSSLDALLSLQEEEMEWEGKRGGKEEAGGEETRERGGRKREIARERKRTRMKHTQGSLHSVHVFANNTRCSLHGVFADTPIIIKAHVDIFAHKQSQTSTCTIPSEMHTAT